MTANSCTTENPTSSATCSVEAINEIEITTDSEESNATVCSILDEIRNFFANYEAGDVESISDITFTGSNYDQSCSLASSNNDGIKTSRSRSLFIGWMIAIPLLAFICIIFCLNILRSREDNRAEEENHSLKDGYNHDTDSDASTVHHVYSPVDVRKCLSGNCMSCSNCELGQDKGVKWVRVGD